MSEPQAITLAAPIFTERDRGAKILVGGQKLRISTRHPVTGTTIWVWREPWWARMLTLGLAAWLALRRRERVGERRR